MKQYKSLIGVLAIVTMLSAKIYAVDSSGVSAMWPTVTTTDSKGVFDIMYTPIESVTPGGGITVDIPTGWTDPQVTNPTMPGFTVAVVNGSTSNVVTSVIGGTTVKVQCMSGLNPGDAVDVFYGFSGMSISGSASVQSSASSSVEFTVSSDIDGNGTYTAIVAGSPDIEVRMKYMDANGLPSGTIFLARDVDGTYGFSSYAPSYNMSADAVFDLYNAPGGLLDDFSIAGSMLESWNILLGTVSATELSQLASATSDTTTYTANFGITPPTVGDVYEMYTSDGKYAKIKIADYIWTDTSTFVQAQIDWVLQPNGSTDFTGGGAPSSATISGTITYDGIYDGNNLIVALWLNDPSRSGEPDYAFMDQAISSQTATTWAYTAHSLPAPGTYYISAIIDANSNTNYDPGEPLVDLAGGVAVSSGENKTGVDFTITDPAQPPQGSTATVTGTISYTGNVNKLIFVAAALNFDTYDGMVISSISAPGAYSLEGLVEGNTYYFISSMFEGSIDDVANIVINRYDPWYLYNDAPDWDNIDPLYVSGNVANLNFSLQADCTNFPNPMSDNGNDSSFGTPYATSLHNASDSVDYYHMQLYMYDNGPSDSVSVSGPGITGSLELIGTSELHGGTTYWYYSANNSTGPGVYYQVPPDSLPTPPLSYTFTINQGTISRVAIATMTAFVDDFVTNLSPVDGSTIGSLDTISWTGFQGAVGYRAELRVYPFDGDDTIWYKDNILTTSVDYSSDPNAVTLIDASYKLIIYASDLNGNQSSSSSEFNFTTGTLGSISGTISYAGSTNKQTVVVVWDEPDPDKDPAGFAVIAAPGTGSYQVQNLAIDTTYYVYATMADGSGIDDFYVDETYPFGVYGVWSPGSEPVATPIPLTGDISSIDLTLVDPSEDPNPFAQEEYEAHVQSEHRYEWRNNMERHVYSTNVGIYDSEGKAYSATVSGDGITGTYNLYSNNQGSGIFWSMYDQSTQTGDYPEWLDYPPNLPLYYTFTINDSSGTHVFTSTITAFMDDLVNVTYPLDNSNLQSMAELPGITWDPVTANDLVTYKIELFETGSQANNYNWSRIWPAEGPGDNEIETTNTYIPYTGPQLNAGQQYELRVRAEADGNNGTFNYSSEGKQIFRYQSDAQRSEARSNIRYNNEGDPEQNVYVSLYDFGQTVTNVTVSGPGIINGSIDLVQDQNNPEQWSQWDPYVHDGSRDIRWPRYDVQGYETPPSLPLIYTFNVTDPISGNAVYVSSVTSWVNPVSDFWPENGRSYGFAVSSFSWTVSPDAENYYFRLEDRGTDNQWHENSNLANQDNIASTATAYNYTGDPLQPGHFYSYGIEARDSNGNSGSVEATFGYDVPELVIVLPGETWTDTAGKSGTPSVQATETGFTVEVRAVDSDKVTIPGFTGMVNLHAQATNDGWGDNQYASAGVATFNVSLWSGGSWTYNADVDWQSPTAALPAAPVTNSVTEELSVYWIQPNNWMQGDDDRFVHVEGSGFDNTITISCDIPDVTVNGPSMDVLDSHTVEFTVDVASTAMLGQAILTFDVSGSTETSEVWINEPGTIRPDHVTAWTEKYLIATAETTQLHATIRDQYGARVFGSSVSVNVIMDPSSVGAVYFNAPGDTFTVVNAVDGEAVVSITGNTEGNVDLQCQSSGLNTGYTNVSVSDLGGTYGTVRGRILDNSTAGGPTDPVYIWAYTSYDTEISSNSGKTTMQTNGDYEAFVVANQDIHLWAFKDINGNGRYDSATDPAGGFRIYNSTYQLQDVWVNAGFVMDWMDIEIYDVGAAISNMSIYNVDPYEVEQGQGLQQIWVWGENFPEGAQVSFDPAISVTNNNRIDQGQIQAEINVTNTLATGEYDIIVASGTAVKRLASAINVRPQGAFSTWISDIQPRNVTKGTTVYFTVYGNGFDDQGGSQSVKLRQGNIYLDIDQANVDFIDPWTISGMVFIDSNKPSGNYDVVLRDNNQNYILAENPGLLYVDESGTYNAGVATRLGVWAETLYLEANGTSETYIHVDVMDANFNPVTNASNDITFTKSGGGGFIGNNVTPAVYGQTSILYRAGLSSGTVRITASAAGLASGSIDLYLYAQGSQSSYGTITGNVFYSGSANGVKYVRAAQASAPEDYKPYINDVDSGTLSVLSAGVKNELALEALKRLIDGDPQGADPEVLNSLVLGFPHGGWKGSAAADNYNSYVMDDASAGQDLMLLGFVDSNNNGSFTKSTTTPSNTEPYGFFKHYGMTGDHPGIIWLPYNGYIDYMNVDIFDPGAGSQQSSIQIWGIDPPSITQAVPGTFPSSKWVWVWGEGFNVNSDLSFYPDNPAIEVVDTNVIDQWSLEAEIKISSSVFPGSYDVIVSSGGPGSINSKAYGIFHVDSSVGYNTVRGTATYGGSDVSTGTVYVGLFKGNSPEGDPFRTDQSISNSTDTLFYEFTGLPDGQYSVYAMIDVTGAGPDSESPLNPFGMCPDNPVYLYGGVSRTMSDTLMFTTGADSIFVSYVDPPEVEQGAEAVTVHVFGGQLDTVSPNADYLNFGPGVSVLSKQVISEYDIQAIIDVSSAAYTGDRNVQVTDENGFVSNAFGVFRVLSSGSQGEGTLSGSISYINTDGTDSGEKSGDIVVAIWNGGVFQGPPLQEDYSAYLATAPAPFSYSLTGLEGGSYSIFTYLDINGDRVPDLTEPQNVYQFNPVNVTDGLTTRVDMTLYDVYTSTSGTQEQVFINDVRPAYVMAGTTVTIEIYGTNFQSNAQLLFGQGISYSSSTVDYSQISDGKITADITINASAAEGFRNVAVRNPDGSSGTGINRLIVTPATSSDDVSSGSGRISGTLYNYSDSTGVYRIALWDGYIFNGPPVRLKSIPALPGVVSSTYSFRGLADSPSYYLGAYIDTDYVAQGDMIPQGINYGNGRPDHIPGVVEEPEVVYGSFESPRSISISGGNIVRNVSLKFEQPETISIKDAVPNTLVRGTFVDVQLWGYGFSSAMNNADVSVDSAYFTLQNNGVKYIDPSQIILKFALAANTPIGTNTITVTNPVDNSTATVTVSVVASVSDFSTATGEAPFTVTVTDGSSVIENALVAAVSFDDTTFEPDASVSRAGYTNSDGECTLFLNTEKSYLVAAGKHMYKPSIKVQMFDPLNTPVSTADGSKTITLTERPDPNVLGTEEYQKVGAVYGKLSNVRESSTKRVLIMAVNSATTDEPANFALIPVSGKTIYYSIGNIPITSETDEYVVNVVDPVFGIEADEVVTSTVGVSVDGVSDAVKVDIDFQDVEDLAKTDEEEAQDVTGVSFSGYIYKDLNSNSKFDDGEGISNARVTFRSYAYRDPWDAPNPGIQTPVEIITNASGKYSVYDLPVYQTGVNGVTGNYVGPPSGYPNNNTYSVSIVAPGYNGRNDYYGSSTGKYTDIERTYAGSEKKLNYALSVANGSINGYIYIGSTNSPVSADVSVWPDHNWYGNLPPNPGLSDGHDRADDGSFNISGLGDGNYMLNVWSEFSQFGYDYNSGNDKEWGTSDDLRITVKNGSYGVYQASSGVKMGGTNNPIKIVLKKTQLQDTSCTINGTLKRLKSGIDMTGTMVVAREDWNSIPDSELDEWGNKRPPRVQFIDLSTFTASSISYSLNVPTGTYYVRVNSPQNGALGESEYQIRFANASEVRDNIDFSIAPAGKISGVIKYPDGRIIKPNWENNEWINVSAAGQNVDCWQGTGLNEDGKFLISGLLPGVYNIRVDLPDSYDYAKPYIENITVTAGATTKQNITLVSADALSFTVADVPSDPTDIQETGTGANISNLVLLAVKTGKSFNVADEILKAGDDDGALVTTYADWANIMSTYTVADNWDWSELKLEPGTYDYYLIYALRFGDDHGQETGENVFNETASGIILDKKTNVTLSTATLEFTYAMGNYYVSGSVQGQNIFTQEDIAKASSNFDYFVDLIPKVTILNSEGVQVGGGAVLPDMGTYNGTNWSNEAVLQNIEQWIATGDLASIRTYFANPANARYKITGLQTGKSYTIIAKSKNYPPVVKKITVSAANVTQNINFDDTSVTAKSARVYGYVKEDDDDPIAGATLVLYTGTGEKKTNSSIDGSYSFDGLTKGSYKIKVSASGYGVKEDKVDAVIDPGTRKDFEFAVVTRSNLSGTVYKQKIPFPKTLEEATVILLDQTAQAASVKGIATKREFTTEADGAFEFTDLEEAHVFKLYVIASGYRLSEYTITKSSYNETQDVVMKSDAPRISVFQWTDANGDRQFQIESNKTLVAKPSVKFIQNLSATPELKNWLVAGLDKIYRLTLYKNTNATEIDLADLGIYSIDVSKEYGLRVVGNDGSQEGVGSAPISPSVKLKVQKIITDLVAAGGDVSVDKSGEDKTKVTINPGAFTLTASTSIPTINIDKVDSGDDTTIGDEEPDPASDVYTLDIDEAEFSANSPLTMVFDYDENLDSDENRVCYYDPSSDQWMVIDQTITKDPVTGTLEIDFTANDIVTAAGANMLPYVPYVKGVGFSPQNTIRPLHKVQTVLSGVKFAVFTSAPSYALPTQDTSNSAYSGTEFRMYNFPNPFNLESKTVSLKNTGNNTALAGNQTITGTILKYYLPAALGNKQIEFNIYNIAGELVRTVDEGSKTGGYIYFTEWDGKNDDGDECASGIYLLIPVVDGETVMDTALRMAIVK